MGNTPKNQELTLPPGWSVRKTTGWLNPWYVFDADGNKTRYAGPSKKQAVANALPDVGVSVQQHKMEQVAAERKMKTDTDIKDLPVKSDDIDYTGTPPFANAAWKKDLTMCQWCAGTGHPHGNPRFGMCKCPSVQKREDKRQ